MSAIGNKIFTITAITFISTLMASPSFAGVLCNIGEKRVRQDVIIADAFSEECLASCASKSTQATYNAPPGWAIVRYWTGTRHDRGRTTRSLSFATAQSHFASSSDFASARSQEASGSAGQHQAGYSAGAKQIESLHNAYRASNTTITLTVTAQGRSPYAGSSKREEALNVEELCIGTIDDYRAAIRDELSLTVSNPQPVVGSSALQLPRVAIIKTAINGRVFDYTHSQINKEPIILVDEHRGSSQQWQLIPLGNGYHLIKSEINGRVLDFTNRRDGEPVILVDEHRGDSQQWKFERLDNGKFLIISKIDGRVLDFSNTQRNGEPLILFHRHGGASQQWLVEGLQ